MIRVQHLLTACLIALVAVSCSRKVESQASENALAPIPFTRYEVQDSSRIVGYPNGVRIYTVLDGPGNFPKEGTWTKVHYQGFLETGKVFDSSYKRGEPLRFTFGVGEIIPGLEYAIGRMRYGTRAIVYIPAPMAYGERKEVPNVPPGSNLEFHLELLGTF